MRKSLRRSSDDASTCARAIKNLAAPAVRREAEEDWGRRGLKSRLANGLQNLFAQNIGIAFTGFDTLDDLYGDGPSYVIAAVSDPQREADNLECKTEDAFGLWVEARPLR